jgi:serine protease
MSDWPRTERSRALRHWTWLVPAATLAFVGCQDDPLPTEPVLETDLSAMTASVQEAGVGADDWIVVFKDGTHDPPGLAKKLTAEHGGTVRSTYQLVLRGFSGKIPPQAIEGIRRNPNVDFVEQDGVVSMNEVGSWGLDRIDQRNLPLSGTFTPGGTGAGVDVWILDTGIDYSRADEFGSRLDQTRDWDFVSNDDDGSDCQGHGTHVAGTVGSKTYGVATGVTLISVRVLGCSGSGSFSGIIDAMEYVVANATRPSVINMSLSGGTSGTVNLAVKNTVAAGVVVAAAAGNDNIDACLRSPASAPEAVTVASSTSSDSRSSFSNFGSCVDVFAPGSSIRSTVMGTGSQSWSGTSMAAPHVAGAAALLFAANPGWTATQVWAAIQTDATPGAISNVAGSPNLLLHVGDGSPPPPPPPACELDCPTADVQWISAVDVTFRNGGRASGAVTVQIVDETDTPLSGVTVNGSWNLNLGDNYRTSSGTTGTDGMVEFSTGTIRNATTFEFCVTGLSAPDHDSGPTEQCSEFGSPVGGVAPPPPPPSAEAPTGLTLTPGLKGKIHRMELSWDGGGPTVDVKLNGATIVTISNSGAYTDNIGKTPSGDYAYQVCNAGKNECTLVETVTYP